MSAEDRTGEAYGPPGRRYPAAPPTQPQVQPVPQQPYPVPQQPHPGPTTVQPGYGYQPLPVRGPAPWSGPKMFFVVYGFAILAGILMGVFVGVLIGGGLSALLGGAFQGMDQALLEGVDNPGVGGFVSAGIGLGIIFGGLFGFGLSMLFGAVGAAIATLTHTRLSPGMAALASAGVPSLLFGTAVLRAALGGNSGSGGGLIALVIGAAFMFVPLFPITFSAIRRSQRAAQGILA